MRATTARFRRRVRARQLFPPVQIESKGEPISIVDAVVSAVLLALALGAIRLALGVNLADI